MRREPARAVRPGNFPRTLLIVPHFAAQSTAFTFLDRYPAIQHRIRSDET
jgi:hypothetical protein